MTEFKTNEDYLSNRLDRLVSSQIDRVTANRVFEQEARYIQRTCEINKLSRVVDFGSWCGILAKEVFDTGIVLDNYHLVDGVPYYMNRALALLSGKPVTNELVTLLPPSYTQDPPKEMLVHPYDTLNTSSLYSEYFIKPYALPSSVHVPLAPCEYLGDYIGSHHELFDSTTYVKIDLDGVDIEFVAELLRQNLQPGCVHFEVWNHMRESATKIIAELSQRGYCVPQADLSHHRNYSVGISKNYWWAVGYDIAAGQTNFTYYDQDHGAEIVSVQ